MAQEEFVFAGFGGQGVLFAGQLLAYAAMDAGKHVTWIPSYGPEMRGGTANCMVVVSDDPIGAPLVDNPSVAVVFSLPSFDKYEPLLAPGGLLVANKSLADKSPERTDFQFLAIPGTDEAERLGSVKMVNTLLLGAALTLRPVVSFDVLIKSLEEHLPESKAALLDANKQAIRRGIELAQASLVAV